MKEIYKKAIEKFGVDGQFLKAAEECNELSKELIKTVNTREAQNITEEIADVEIMLEQLKIIFDKEIIKEIKNKKLKRLKNRLKEVED